MLKIVDEVAKDRLMAEPEVEAAWRAEFKRRGAIDLHDAPNSGGGSTDEKTQAALRWLGDEGEARRLQEEKTYRRICLWQRVVHNANSSFSTGGGINIGGPPSVICTGPAICFGGSSSKVANGWTLGGGLEYAFWQRWMVKAEYLYVSLDSNSVTENALVTDPGAAPASLNASFGLTNFNVVRVGLNYQFH